MIIDAVDEDDALSQAGHDVLSIEESMESVERNKQVSNYQASVVFKIIEPESSKKSLLEQQVDKLIIAVNQTKNISVWERKFAYGLKRCLTEKNRLSKLQTAKFQELYAKLVR